MKILYACERTFDGGKDSLFLAGPSPRGNGEYDWRKEAYDKLHQIGFDGIVYTPIPRNDLYRQNYDYDEQIEWELEYLEKAGVIVFWIPRDLVTLPGFTTNVEFGRFSRKGNVVLGFPISAPKMRYLQYIANVDGVPVFHTMEQTLQAAVRLLLW